MGMMVIGVVGSTSRNCLAVDSMASVDMGNGG